MLNWIPNNIIIIVNTVWRIYSKAPSGVININWNKIWLGIVIYCFQPDPDQITLVGLGMTLLFSLIVISEAITESLLKQVSKQNSH